ncbi:MAG: hypothetical protein KF754_06730 [Planctomycetes bacterium]|nr:hypothetical protein [Planctomycetota bacterium]
MQKVKTIRRKRSGLAWRVLAASAIAIVLICLGIFAGFHAIGHSLQETGMRTAQQGVVDAAQRLRSRVGDGGEAGPELTMEELMGWQPDFQRFGHFDHGRYALHVRGAAPAFGGTTITYRGRPPQTSITLTVEDLPQSKWVVEVEEMPRWWQAWR